MNRNNFLSTSLTIFLLMAATLNNAEAHSFKVGFLVPLTGEYVDQGRDAVDALLLAADERDGHPDNHADGHLGGLDVYVLKIDTNRDNQASLNDISHMVKTDDIQFITGLIPPKLGEQISLQLKNTTAHYIGTPVDNIANMATMSGEGFAASFSRRYSRSPSLSARQGYRIALYLDRIVREIAGEFSDYSQIEIVLKSVLGSNNQ